jgi:hypothetical protein
MRDLPHHRGDVDDAVAFQHAQAVIIEADEFHGSPPENGKPSDLELFWNGRASDRAAVELAAAS